MSSNPENNPPQITNQPEQSDKVKTPQETPKFDPEKFKSADNCNHCKNCKCPLFNYVPIHGSMDLKCSCHHSFEDHDPVTKKCTKGCSCKKFSSNYTCDCGLPYDQHHTEIETREERIKLGKNVDAGNNMVAGIGGLGSFGGMVNNAYRDQYKDLLEGDEMKALPGENKKMIGNTENKGKGNSGNNGGGVLGLLNQPNKFGK